MLLNGLLLLALYYILAYLVTPNIYGGGSLIASVSHIDLVRIVGVGEANLGAGPGIYFIDIDSQSRLVGVLFVGAIAVDEEGFVLGDIHIINDDIQE